MIKKPDSLFARTSLTLAFGIFLFIAFSFLFTWFFILDPFSNRAANDLAALIKLTSEKWLSLTPAERSQYEKKIARDFDLYITEKKEIATEPLNKYYPFVPKLKKALTKHIGPKIKIKQSLNDHSFLWIELHTNRKKIYYGFYHNRQGPRPPIALAGIFLSATFVIILITLLLVQHITHPLKKIINALGQFEKSQMSFSIPETGPSEISYLAKTINKMLQEINLLLENRSILFAGISHDLRSPITRMQIALELFETETLKDRLLLKDLKKDLLEMESLIQQSMEFIKGLDKQSPIQIDLDNFFKEIVADYKKHGLTIILKSHQCGTCIIQHLALKRILCNLLDNAFQYSHNTPVTLFYQKKPGYLLIEIIDQGPGIPKDKIETVFQPFFRLEQSRNKRTGGSGMGLAIVYQLCKAHGWIINLIPNKEQGLTATLKIPETSADKTPKERPLL